MYWILGLYITRTLTANKNATLNSERQWVWSPSNNVLAIIRCHGTNRHFTIDSPLISGVQFLIWPKKLTALVSGTNGRTRRSRPTQQIYSTNNKIIWFNNNWLKFRPTNEISTVTNQAVSFNSFSTREKTRQIQTFL